MTRRTRDGFALVAMLWLIVGMTALAMDDTARDEDALGASRNRINAVAARWRAEGCIAAARDISGAALADSTRAPRAAWDTLDLVLAAVPGLQGTCRITARAAGTQLDVNATDGDGLRAAFVAAGEPSARADSLADAIQDWRDPDSLPRPSGAEASWYRDAGRVGPSNRPFTSAAEIRLVRGFRHTAPAAALLTVEPGRILLDRAPLPVVASLPGMTPEALGRIAELRWRGERLGDISRLAASLSDAGRAALNAAYPALIRRVTSEPDAWTVSATGVAGTPPVAATEEVRLVRAGRRAGVVRRRLLP